MVEPGTVSKEFKESLVAYDPWLRVEWNHRNGVWDIKRKVEGRDWLVMEVPYRAQRIRYEGGYLNLLVGCDWQVIWSLYMGDVQRRGGARRVADEMDEAYYAMQRKERAQRLDLGEDMAKSRWDSANTNYPHHGHSSAGRGDKLSRLY